MAKKAATPDEIESIDLALRFKNDGGPLYRFLAEQKNFLTRCERVRQLMYLGLLCEQGLTRSTMVTVTPIQSESVVPAQSSNVPSTVEVNKQQGADSVVDSHIHAEDLGEIFGAAG